MDQAFRIETLDRSGRWYLTPGARSIYDLQIRNDSKNPADCSLLIEDPSFGAMANPHSFTLRGHEVRTVTVTFAADAHPTRSQRVAITLRDDAGAVLATFEHPLIITGGTDCSVSLAWKDAIVEAGEPRGFELLCTVRSQSEGPASFPISFTAHPSLVVPALQAMHLDPGQAGEVVIPVRWNRAVKDGDGKNHPVMLEANVPVSNGRRTSRLRWDMIESRLTAFSKPPAPVAAEPDSASARRPDPSFAWNNIVAAVQGSKALPAPAASFEAKGQRAIVTTSATPAWRQVTHAQAQSQVQDSSAAHVVELPLFPGLATTSTPPAPPPQVARPAAQLPGAAGAQPPRKPAPRLTPYATTGLAPRENPIQGTAPTATAAVAAAAVVAASAAARAATDAELDAALTSAPNSAETLEVAPATAKVFDVQPAIAKKRFQPPRAGLLIGGLAVIALALAGVLFRPWITSQAPSTSPVVVSAPVAAIPLAPQVPEITLAPPHKSIAPHKSSAAHKTAASMPLPQQPAARPVATVQPVTAAPATQKPAAHHVAPVVAAHQPARARPFQRYLRYQPANGGAVVALGGIEAFYGPRGRAVRVIWSAAEQSSANVQLIDDHGTTVNAVTVHGGRQAVTMSLPRRFHGPLTVQVSSVGRLGERVAQTTSLAAFGE